MNRYPFFSRLLHWFIAIEIIGLIGLGWYMVGLSYYDRWYNSTLSLHRSFGMLVLMLANICIVWKISSKYQASSTGLKSWERIASKAMHGVLFLVMLIIPVTGYLISSSAGASFAVFGKLNIPALFSVNNDRRDLAILVHYYLAYFTALLILAHAVAALKHHFLNKDDTLKRML